MPDIWKNNKIFNCVEISIGFSKFNGLPGILVPPSYQDWTLKETRKKIYEVSKWKIMQKLNSWKFQTSHMHVLPSLGEATLQVVGHQSNRWNLETHQQHQVQVLVAESYVLVHLWPWMCRDSTKHLNNHQKLNTSNWQRKQAKHGWRYHTIMW